MRMPPISLFREVLVDRLRENGSGEFMRRQIRMFSMGLLVWLSVVGCCDSEDRASASEESQITYMQVKQRFQKNQEKLNSEYSTAESGVEKEKIVNDAREFVFSAIRDVIFPRWIGTAWDFNGTTEVPGQGKIACGYFVTTVLRDAGLKVERFRLAQQTSERIVLSLTAEEHVRRYSHVSIEAFCQAVKNWGEGCFVVGLDCHVGFIINDDSGLFFVHSSYMDPYAVVKEPALESRPLIHSEYRVLGKLSADDELLKAWILGRSIKTKIQ